jgi:hypothetical protein
VANLISSIGYSLGKVHTGMLAFLCELHREGVRGPLECLLGHLGVPLPVCPKAKREWNSIDLAIFDGENVTPALLIEMKVDDHDHETTKWIDGNKATGYQTDIYARAFPNCEGYLYITLGIGEYFHAPYGTRFRWVRLPEFSAALNQVKSDDGAIADWKAALLFEAELRERVRRDDRSRIADFRPGAWNICFLGQLKEELESFSGNEFRNLDCTCYTWGTRPDTILNFGWRNDTEYLEINNDGLLNFKVTLNDCSAEAAKKLIGNSLGWLRSSYAEGTYEIRDGGRIGASKTVASFNVGLAVQNGLLGFARERTYVIDRLREILQKFYSQPL